MSKPKQERISFGKIKEVIEPPNLIEIQTKSYEEFLQRFTEPGKRLKMGLQAVLSEHFPIESYDGKIRLEYLSYEIVDPKISDFEAIRLGENYTVSLKVNFRLTCEDYSAEETVYMGEIPMITDRGTFVVNGAERVIVAQLHRSPGICFEKQRHTNGKDLFSFRIIPDRGSWLEVQFDQSDLMYVFLDRRRRRRKFLATTFLRYLGYESDRSIVELFYTIQKLKLKGVAAEELEYLIPFEDVKFGEKGTTIAKAYEPLSLSTIKKMLELGIKEIEVIDQREEETLVKTLKKDPAHNREEALREIFRRFRPGDPSSVQQAGIALDRLFKDEKRYDLTRVGRYKINRKLGLDVPEDCRLIQPIDFLAALKYLLRLKQGEGQVDDIDHLGNRRVRAVGELISNQCRVGLSRTERLVKERMTLCDISNKDIVPSKLINPKALNAVVRDFFGRSQLSQFMDQINPLAELTHKRRLSALGPGGLNRDRAGFEVRDVHPSHYGRICPIETPEGPNIGLINSLCTYARIDEYGFIETPFRRVRRIEKKNKKGEVTDVEVVVTNEVEYLTADKEEYHLIAQANNPIDHDDGNGHFVRSRVTARERGEFIEVDPRRVEYMDVSPKQIISIAAGLIPFLEHDDANRALMGANMQRQGVPLMVNQAPLVGTGIEAKCARDSCAVVCAKGPGIVASATAEYIVTTPDGILPVSPQRWLSDPKGSIVTDPDKGIYVYALRKFMRSNASTCINQRPIVSRGDVVKAGDVLADGPCTDGGELALGRNVLVAYMSWYGYNFEDAIIISERLVQEDAYTSIHIEEFSEQARDTKLGPEEITRDIPNVGEDALKNLDSDGVVRVGAEVKPGDILVGKITPKSETDLAPEERLLRAIFGEKAADVKDTSLRVPPGTTGVVMDVRVTRSKHLGVPPAEAEKESQKESQKQRKKVDQEYQKAHTALVDELTSKLADHLLNTKITLEVTRAGRNETIIPAGRKITKTLLRKLAENYREIEMSESPVRNKIFEIINRFAPSFDELDAERDRKLEIIEAGDEIDSGVVTDVKVYIATKRKLGVGDKMAGRHGNKGVCSRVLPIEDMPYLEDGTPVDIILNPLGVPSRMNVGQVLEAHLGVAAKALGFKVATPVFDGIDESKIWDYMSQTKKVPGFTWVGDGRDGTVAGKSRLIDGLTGEYFHYPVVVGYTYMLKLNHLVADKVHARAVGTYSLVTQQPLGGKAQHGGQRFGEMEVWAMEAYGAAYTLQELLTVKSDDVQGRTRIYENIVKGDNSLDAGTPESFNVLIKEMQALCLNVQPLEKKDRENAPQTTEDFFQLLASGEGLDDEEEFGEFDELSEESDEFANDSEDNDEDSVDAEEEQRTEM